jgi:hypothetical protein
MSIVVSVYLVDFIICNRETDILKTFLELIHWKHKMNCSTEVISLNPSFSNKLWKPFIYVLCYYLISLLSFQSSFIRSNVFLLETVWVVLVILFFFYWIIVGMEVGKRLVFFDWLQVWRSCLPWNKSIWRLWSGTACTYSLLRIVKCVNVWVLSKILRVSFRIRHSHHLRYSI